MTDGLYLDLTASIGPPSSICPETMLSLSTEGQCRDPQCMCRHLPAMTDRADRIIGVERVVINDSPASSIPADAVNTTTFAGWIALEPVSTPVALLYAIAIDLGRRGWGGCAFEVRRQADDLEMLTRNAP